MTKLSHPARRTLHRLLCAAVVASAAAAATTFFAARPAPAVAALPNKNTQIVALANAYIASLTSTQQTATVVANTAANVAKWSNLPAQPSGSTGTTTLRNGVAFSTLTAAQQAAFTNLAKAALGEEGYGRFMQIRAADSYLTSFNSGYSGNYQYMAFCGTPSTTGNWMLQVGGHHNAHNYYYSGNTLITATPYHIGSEPTTFTYAGGTYTPIGPQRDGMIALLGSLTSTQLTSAKLTTSFSDVALGPGKDARSNFPTGTTNRGIIGSSLTTAQQALVKTAMKAWTQDCPLASAYQTLYESEINSTYVAYSGSTTTLSTQGDYIRIDGPHVWMEIAAQGGIVISGQIHYHTIWRDRVTDYNAAYGF